MSTPSLRIHVDPAFSDACMVAAFEGWNDAGESASSAVQYVSAGVQSVPLAEIDGEDYLDYTVRRPTVHFGEHGVREIDWPATRFRYGSLDADGAGAVRLGHLGSPPPRRVTGADTLQFDDVCPEIAQHLGTIGSSQGCGVVEYNDAVQGAHNDSFY